MTIYKQMEYQMRLPEYETLAEGKDGGYEWKALSLGTLAVTYPSLKTILSMEKTIGTLRTRLKCTAD
ncbi:hypothetical protein [Parasutterella excrementihominis]|uniref:hypothetical protein n=1 Tax=Parasutterella excrementihominis TaxID=487175 RepID=UPI0012BB9946|nr:hypothetical protein [Parasutterella excrementihominis]MTT66245.1 hypothetical protein [Parasutterella excrementihominis]MTT95412.1 hypothetical protein [Parasutterella excrementihominis]